MPNTFFQNLFCGAIQADLTSCREANTTLSKEYDTLFSRAEILQTTVDALKASVESWKREYDQLQRQYKILQDSALIIPDISPYLSNGLLQDVYDLIDTRLFQMVLSADVKYYSLDYHQWLDILAPMQLLVEDTWQEERYDCDNFAEMLHAFVSRGVKESPLDRQLMIAIAWSRTHAYNVFHTKSDNWFIYEPQNNTVVGEVFDEDLEPSYQTRLLLFIQ